MSKKPFVYFILLFLLSSCQTEVEKSEIKLPYDLGKLSFEDHLHFDWQFEWIDYSDMANLQERKVRFAQSKYEPLCESGFFHSNYPDSVCQMTLTSYTEDAKKVYNKSNPSWGFNELLTFRKRFSKLRVLGDNIIDSTYVDWLGYTGYSITYENSCHPNFNEICKAFVIDTEISSIELLFECTGNNCSFFLQDVDKTVRSMRLTE